MDTAHEVLPNGPGRRDVQRIVQRHRAVAEQRLARIHSSLTREQSHFLKLLPLLLHLNHPALPGYTGSDAPAGIAGYTPDADTLLLARRFARGLKKAPRSRRQPPLLGLYLIGSLGTLGQDRQSDFDFWLCHRQDLDATQMRALRDKTAQLEAHAASLGLRATFFHMLAEDFRKGRHSGISNESSGHTQHHLLLEEFYRSGLLLAGRPPLWWLVPPEQTNNYSGYCDRLIGQRFVRARDWLDFGGLESISAKEFFSAAHWQLYKSIGLPYKAVLKLMLFEAYADEFPNVRWLCDDVKALIHSDQELDADAVDAYRLLLERVDAHLQNDAQRLKLARRAFYFKSGVRLSTAQSGSWKAQRMRSLVDRWGWDQNELLKLDARPGWKVEQVIKERNRLVAELSHSYRLLTELAHNDAPTHHALGRELALLGRKLYAALERRPGKIDRVNPAISEDLAEEAVSIRRDADGNTWHLYLQPVEDDRPPLRSASSLVELLAWVQVNGVVDKHTRIDLPAAQRGPVADEYQRILRQLQKHLPAETERSIPLAAFAGPAAGRLSSAFINSLQRVQASEHGHLLVSERADPLSFGAARTNLVQQIDHLYSNTWGELQVDHYQGGEGLLDMLCSHLTLFRRSPPSARLECRCDTPGYAHAISIRLSKLADTLLRHFAQHGETARYLLRIAEDFHLLEQRHGEFAHVPLGGEQELLEFLAETLDHSRATALDHLALPDSPLAFVLQQNRPDQVQFFYQTRRNGIELWVLDRSGALYHQSLTSGAEESYFLDRQQRFFATLQAWHSPLDANGSSDRPVHFLRLSRERGTWLMQPVYPRRFRPAAHTELLLSTGRRGPWEDGFSLISGSREFNSMQLGERLYDEVARYLFSLRAPGNDYPIYLTGVMVADGSRPTPLPLVQLLRFKGLIEQRLAGSVRRLRLTA